MFHMKLSQRNLSIQQTAVWVLSQITCITLWTLQIQSNTHAIILSSHKAYAKTIEQYV